MAKDKEIEGIMPSMPFSLEMRARIKEFKNEWYEHYKRISKEETPLYDGSGRQVIKRRPDGKDYIDDAWMTDRLNKHFPGWSWEAVGSLQFLGSEWVVATGHLCIIDERLLAFGINPPIRKYFGGDAVRIQFKRDTPHTPENIIDVGDNCQSAITGAKKRAINRLTGIGDDIYGKRVEEEGAGTAEEIMARSNSSVAPQQAKILDSFLSKHHILWSEAFKILGVSSQSEITSPKEAWDKIKQAKGIEE